MLIRSGSVTGADGSWSSVRCGFAGEDDTLMAGTHLDEQAFAVREDGSGVVKDAGFGPVLAALVMVHAAFEANGCIAGNRTSVVHFHVAGHTHHVAGANSLAHGFVEEGGDDAAVHVAARAFKGVWN